MKRYNLVYKTVNMINSKFYIGKHSTNILEDEYLGSGLLLSAAILMYGKENFTREILYFADTAEAASALEKEIVTENLLSNPNCYNIALGGTGGNLGEEVNKKIGKKMSIINSKVPKTEQHKQALREVWIKKEHKLDSVLKEKIKKAATEKWALMSSEERKSKCGHSGKSNGFFGKKHSIESIELMKSKLPERSGSMNPRAKKVTVDGIVYGTRKECMEKLNISKRKLNKLLGEIK
jgi:group I intron endonuclease